MNARFLFALCLPLWGCSDGSEGLGPSTVPSPNGLPAAATVPPVSDTPSGATPAQPDVSIVMLEKGKVSWPFGAWIDGANVGSPVFSPTPGEDGAVRFTFEVQSKHAEILTHHHFDLTRGHQSILVRARASAPLSILVTTARLDDSTDYWAQLDAGHPWRVADLALETTWTDFDIPIASLQARGPGEPQPFSPATATGVVLFGFLLTNPGAIDVWFEHIEIK